MATYQHFVTLPTLGGTMPVFIATPEGRENANPAMLVIHGMHGIESHEMEAAERLAREGYVAAVPDMFHRRSGAFSRDELDQRRRSMLDPDFIADVQATMGYLKAQPYVVPDRIGIMGFCMGGRVSYLMAGVSPDIRVAADFYGGGVFQGEGGPAPIDLTPNIRCPIAIFDGEQDHRPTPEDVRNTESALKQHGIVHEVHLYPGVGHAFMSQSGPDRRQDVIDDAWAQLLRWIEKPLRAEVAAGIR